MGSLTLVFSGICTHFRFGVVAGVPHRVVLPDASKVMFGLVSVPTSTTAVGDPPPDPLLYYTTPHFAQLELTTDLEIIGELADLTIAGLMIHGDIGPGVRIQIANATDTQMVYFGGPHNITDYAQDYNISNDVVLNGRAMCYIDLFGGTLTMLDPVVTGGPRQASIKVQTDGIPKLLVTPLGASTPSDKEDTSQVGAKSYLQRLTKTDNGPQDIIMHVRNHEPAATLESQDAGGQFDYLLHLLTAMGGIPQRIKQPTPGMGSDLQSATAEQIAGSLRGLANALEPPKGPSSKRRLITQNETTPSCSCSQYP
jgi:hypothetical protein